MDDAQNNGHHTRGFGVHGHIWNLDWKKTGLMSIRCFNHLFYSLLFDTHALEIKTIFYKSFISLNLLIADRTEAAAVVEQVQAPPATVMRQFFTSHFQIPTATRFMFSWNLKIVLITSLFDHFLYFNFFIIGFQALKNFNSIL